MAEGTNGTTTALAQRTQVASSTTGTRFRDRRSRYAFASGAQPTEITSPQTSSPGSSSICSTAKPGSILCVCDAASSLHLWTMSGSCLITNGGMFVAVPLSSCPVHRNVVNCRPDDIARDSRPASTFQRVEAKFPKESLLCRNPPSARCSFL